MVAGRDGGGDGVGSVSGSVARRKRERKVAAVAIPRCAFERSRILWGNRRKQAGGSGAPWLRRDGDSPTVRTPSVYLLIASASDGRAEGRSDNGSPKRSPERESEKESQRSPKRSPERSPKREGKDARSTRISHGVVATVTLHDATGRPFTPCDILMPQGGHRWSPVHSA